MPKPCTLSGATVVEAITVDWLKDQDACSKHVRLFRKTFGDRAELTTRNLRLASRAGLDLHWLTEHLLTAPAFDAYEQATAPAWAAYEQAVESAFMTYDQATSPTLAAYKQAKESAWTAYNRAVATALENTIFPSPVSCKE